MLLGGSLVFQHDEFEDEEEHQLVYHDTGRSDVRISPKTWCSDNVEARVDGLR